MAESSISQALMNGKQSISEQQLNEHLSKLELLQACCPGNVKHKLFSHPRPCQGRLRARGAAEVSGWNLCPEPVQLPWARHCSQAVSCTLGLLPCKHIGAAAPRTRRVHIACPIWSTLSSSGAPQTRKMWIC